MGGLGSTRWHFTRTKQVVESSLQIAAPRTHKRAVQVLSSTSGVYRWPAYGSRVAYHLDKLTDDLYLMTLHHSGVVQYIHLEATAPNYGGLRWWFSCPRCERRSAKLYLPPRQDLFACRTCHRLSYESAQAAGSFAYRLFQSDARRLGVSTRTAREWLRKHLGGRVVADLVGQAEPASARDINQSEG